MLIGQLVRKEIAKDIRPFLTMSSCMMSLKLFVAGTVLFECTKM